MHERKRYILFVSDRAFYVQSAHAFIPEEAFFLIVPWVDEMCSWSIAVAEDTENPCDAEVEVRQWTLTKMLPYFRLSNVRHGRLRCRNQLVSQHDPLTLKKHQSIENVLKVNIVRACKVSMTGERKPLPKYLKETLVNTSTLIVLLSYAIEVIKKHFVDRQVLYGPFCMAASATDFQLLLDTICMKTSDKRGNSDTEKTDKEPVDLRHWRLLMKTFPYQVIVPPYYEVDVSHEEMDDKLKL